MGCPFELPVKKTVTHVTEAGVKYQVQTVKGKRALAAFLTKEEADYIVQAINSHDKLIKIKQISYEAVYTGDQEASDKAIGLIEDIEDFDKATKEAEKQ